jgi:hypothetical protein
VRYDLMAVVGVLLAMWVVCLGCGLALERVTRLRLSNALLLPLGLCVAVVAVLPVYSLGLGEDVAIPLLVAIVLAGLVLAEDGVRARVNPGWPGLAGLAAYALYMLPVIAHGRWTWAGYDFVNDSSFEMLFAEHIKHYGTVLGNIPETSEKEFLKSYLASGYPLGTQALLGTFSGLTDTPSAVIYDGYIAFLVGSAAVSLASIAGRLVSARRAACVAAVAVSASITYQYAMQGAIKELGLLAALSATLALACEALALKRAYAGAVLVAVCAAAALCDYNAVALPFLGATALLLGLAVLVLQRVRLSRRWIAPVLTAGGVAALLAIPALVTFSTFFNVAQTGQGSTGTGAGQLGQLLRPLPLSQISGVWLNGEYRLPVPPGLLATLTVLATVAIFALIVPCAIWAFRRREAGPLLVLGTMAMVMVIVYPRVSPYAQGKLQAIISPAVLLLALLALLGVRGRLAPVAVVLALALAGAVWGSDMLVYSYARVAPTGEIEAITDTGDHFRGQGLVLWNEFQEYAKLFANAAKISVPFEALTPQQVELINPTYFYGHYFDLDQERLPFVEGYPIVVTRRSPTASRPPVNYRLVYENHYYLGWRRTATPRVLEHLPEQQLNSPSKVVECAALGPLVAKAPAGSELIAAFAPEVAWFEPLAAADRTYGWGADPARAGAVITPTPGHASGVVRVGAGARYAVWVQGEFPRAIEVHVDGRLVGSVKGWNTVGQWLQAASIQLTAGRHTIEVSKPGGRRHFGPGERAVGSIGAVELQREAPEHVVSVPLTHWQTLCGENADWVEIVRP